MKKIILMLVFLFGISLSLYPHTITAEAFPPYVSVYQTFEVLDFVSGNKKVPLSFLSTTFLELTLGSKVFFDMPLGATIIPIGNTGITGYSYGLGIGVALLDRIDEEKNKRDLLRATLIYSGKYYSITEKTSAITEEFLSLLGGQIALTYHRYSNQSFGLRFGANFGIYTDKDYAVALNYGVSIGLSF